MKIYQHESGLIHFHPFKHMGNEPHHTPNVLEFIYAERSIYFDVGEWEMLCQCLPDRAPVGASRDTKPHVASPFEWMKWLIQISIDCRSLCLESKIPLLKAKLCFLKYDMKILIIIAALFYTHTTVLCGYILSATAQGHFMQLL